MNYFFFSQMFSSGKHCLKKRKEKLFLICASQGIMSKTYKWLLVMLSIFTIASMIHSAIQGDSPFVSQYKLLFCISLCPNLNCGVFKAINKPLHQICHLKYTTQHPFYPQGVFRRFYVIRIICGQYHTQRCAFLFLLGIVVNRLTEMSL